VAKLDKPHVMGRVQTEDRAREVIELCDRQGWYVTVEVAPNKPEDLSDIERQVNGQPRAATLASAPKLSRNDPCSCGSGRKFKKCHGA